jgi:hypothetical protein
MILTAAFWRAAGLRALYTVLAAALPLIAPLVGVSDLRTVLEAVVGLAFAALASLVTSLLNLPEAGGGRSRWAAILDRVVRSFAQVLAAVLAAAATFGDVDWAAVLVQAGAAALVTLIRVIIAALPEDITATPAVGDRVVTSDGVHGVLLEPATDAAGATFAAVLPDDENRGTWFGPTRDVTRVP